MGTKGTLLLTEQKGLMWREPVAERIDWTAATTAPAVGRPTTTAPATRPSDADVEASVVTAGKTLKMSNDPWAARGKPIEIDSEGGDDTRAALLELPRPCPRPRPEDRLRRPGRPGQHRDDPDGARVDRNGQDGRVAEAITDE